MVKKVERFGDKGLNDHGGAWDHNFIETADHHHGLPREHQQCDAPVVFDQL